MGVQRSDL